jgi:uncharacterized protein
MFKGRLRTLHFFKSLGGLSLLAFVTMLVATSRSGFADISYTSVGAAYFQNFDGLSQTGNSNAWTDNSTLPGWYSNMTSYRASTGNSAVAAMYSFGTSSDRALGGVATSLTDPIRFSLGLINNTGLTIDTFTVTYDGEQWRRANNTNQHQLSFDYMIGTGLSISSTGYISVPQLDFVGPITGTTGGAIDGNLAVNRVSGITFTVTGVNWNPGEQLRLRWTDLIETGLNHGLAIDNFSFVGTVSVPEPSAAGLMLMATVLFSFWRRQRTIR